MSRLALMVLLLAAAGTPARADSSSSGAENELRAITQELLDAVAPGDVAVWDRYLDETLIHVDENGTVRGKAELLATLTPLPPGLVGSIAIDTFRSSLHGDTAIAAYEIQEHLDYHGQILRSRFRSVDTWRKTENGWRLIAEHTAAVLKDPPAIELPRATLCAYAGRYRLTEEIETTIVCDDEGLLSKRAGRPDARYLAETEDMFFSPGQPRTRRYFQRDDAGAVTGFVDRREGEDIKWRRE
ncbi:MAG: DUF4440 domain-containing protein [Pseudomonadota bacterium]|nr:DUF4440 domain-containing protein [Pseudomonadota bacterium]